MLASTVQRKICLCRNQPLCSSHHRPADGSARPRSQSIQYDHAYTLEDREERLDALSGALWRGIYSRNTKLDEDLVRLMAVHVDSELSDMHALDEVRAREEWRVGGETLRGFARLMCACSRCAVPDH